MPIAQTNLQLQNQLDACGWSEADRIRLARAYTLACELFSATLRPSGKTFVAHVVGTTSIAVATNASPDEAVAAMLHAAYFEGDFGDNRIGATDEKRAEVRGIVGADAEQLILAYAEWPWRPRLAAVLQDGAMALRPDERSLAHLRIANEIEDWVDLAVAYVPNRSRLVFPLANSAECARRLDLPRLAQLADEVATANAGKHVPPGLQSAPIACIHLPPRSLRPSFPVQAREQIVRIRNETARMRRAVGRIPGARRLRDWLRDSALPWRHR